MEINNKNEASNKTNSNVLKEISKISEKKIAANDNLTTIFCLLITWKKNIDRRKIGIDRSKIQLKLVKKTIEI